MTIWIGGAPNQECVKWDWNNNWNCRRKPLGKRNIDQAGSSAFYSNPIFGSCGGDGACLGKQVGPVDPEDRLDGSDSSYLQ